MKIFLHEIRTRLKSTVLWSLAIALLVAVCLVKYGTLSGDAGATKTLMQSLPATVQAVFGMTGLDPSVLSGYFGMCVIFIAVMLGVHAGMLGSGILADEEIDKTAEFLYAKPVSRVRVVTEKLLAGMLFIAVLWGVTVVSCFVSFGLVAPRENIGREMWLFAAVFALLQLLFFALGALSAAIAQNAKNAARFIAAAVFGGYIFSMLHNLSPNLAWFKYISPFAYFDAAGVVKSQSLEAVYVWVCLFVSLSAIVLTYLFYNKRDINT